VSNRTEETSPVASLSPAHWALEPGVINHLPCSLRQLPHCFYTPTGHRGTLGTWHSGRSPTPPGPQLRSSIYTHVPGLLSIKKKKQRGGGGGEGVAAVALAVTAPAESALKGPLIKK
jgi:hypothetical protein